MCVVRSIETLSDERTAEQILYLTVSVPSAPGGAAVPVTIQVISKYIGGGGDEGEL
jgi:hypothetical protein